MTIRVSPTEPNPAYHFKLTDRSGRSLGLIACATDGKPHGLLDASLFVKSPVNTTAFKQTSGSSSYDIFNYPYAPVVQDDLSGGRGNLDFERDSTKFFDSFRTLSGRANKAYAGPLEQWTSGLRNQVQNMPGSVDFVQMTGNNRVIYKRFQATAFTAGQIWLLMRRTGKPGDLNARLYTDSSGEIGTGLSSITIPYTSMNDILMEWLKDTISETFIDGNHYWLVLTATAGDGDTNHWKVAVKESVGSTYTGDEFSSSPTAANFDLYFRITDSDAEKTCIPFEYKEQQYFVISGTSGAPKIYMAGDRGAADANTGNLGTLQDATKSWTTDEHVGSVVLITDGPGKTEKQPWRIVTGNDGTSLEVDEDWTIEHTTATEYVILGTKLREIISHGLTAPVTDVLVSTTGVIYFCMGDDVRVRRLRAFNDAGTWKDFGHADCKTNEAAATKGVFITYKPQAQKIIIANNSDANGDVSVRTNSNTSPNIPEWGTDLIWGTEVKVDNKYRRINGLAVYPDIKGDEAVWIFKSDMPFILPSSGNPYPVSIEEMRTVRSEWNGRRPLRHGVYLIFPLLQGLERYYGGNFEDIGPNLGEGLPANRRGPIVAMQGYPGKYFIAVDAGTDGYSSILDSGGWHERYRAPKGQRIGALAFQVVPGNKLDRLWVFQGNDLIWLPFPSDSTNELEDENYEHVPEFAVTLARMHAGIFDVQKIVNLLKLQTEQLETDPETGRPICWFELDYRLNNETEWKTIDDPFTISPTQSVDFAEKFGVSGRRQQWRIRGYTRDKSKTPVFLAIIIFCVLRVDVKSFYGPFQFRIEDNQKIGLRGEFRDASASEQLQLLEDWGDASNDSMLKLESVSSMCDDKMIFMNLGARRQIGFKRRDGNEHTSDVYVVEATFQDA